MNSESPAVIPATPTGALLGQEPNSTPSSLDRTPLIVQPEMSLRALTGNAIRVMGPVHLENLAFKYGLDALTWTTSGTGTVTNVLLESAVDVNCPAGASDTVLLTTLQYYRALCGQPLDALIALKHPDIGIANQARNWGPHETNDGLFFQLDGTTVQIVIRSSASGSVIDTPFLQTDWNIDKMNGSGPSGKTLNLTVINVYEVRYNCNEMAVEFYINGYAVHAYKPDGIITAPFTRTLQLPMRVSIINTGSVVGARTLRVYGGYVQFIGTEGDTDVTFAAYNDLDVAVTTTEKPILSIRLASLFKTVTNRMEVVPSKLAISTEGARAGIRLVLNATTLTPAGSWVDVDAESGVQYNRHSGGGAAIAGGTTVYRNMLPNANDRLDISIADIFDFTRRALRIRPSGTDVLTITGVNELSGTTQMRASLNWIEKR